MDPARPFSSPAVWKRGAPFLAVLLLAFLLVPLPPRGGGPGHVYAAAGIAALLVCAVVLVPWSRLPSWTEGLPVLLYLPVIALLRDAEGGAVSPFAALVFLPVLWFALYGSRSQLMAAIALIPPFFLLPMLLGADSGYPTTEVERALVSTGLGALVGFAVHGLVSQIRSQADRLEEETRVDSMTGALNRRGWEQAVRETVSAAEMSGKPLCLAMIDMDHLKLINDAYGHQAGNLVLERAASAWRTALRKADRLARYGGDEFGVLLPDTGREEGCAIVERLRSATPPGTSCSIGIAHWDTSEDAEHLMGRADAALYEAKRAGRGRVFAAQRKQPALLAPRAATAERGENRAAAATPASARLSARPPCGRLAASLGDRPAATPRARGWPDPDGP